MAKRRPNNDGSITEREGRNKPWQAQIMFLGKRMTKSFHKQSQAIDWLTEMKMKMKKGMDVDVISKTLRDGIAAWLEESKEKQLWAYKTYQQYEGLHRKHIRPSIKKQLKLVETKPYHIRRIINIAANRGAKGRTLQLVRMLLHSYFNDMIDEGYLHYNPVGPVKVSYKSSTEIIFLTDEEIEIFLRAAERSRLSVLYRIALDTGMRQGELLGLKWRDVDLQNKSIYVRRQFGADEGGWRLKDVKTNSSRRRISLGQSTCEALEEQRRRLEIESSTANRWEENDLVFPSTVGTPIYPGNLRKNFSRVLEAANVPKLRFHDLRHTAASLWLRLGIHPQIVSERLGHASIRITLDTYSHLIPSLQEDAAKKVDGFLSELDYREDVGEEFDAQAIAAKLQRKDEKQREN